tara:strand:- start:289 stop:480 length:192 start_codon:yes stop_codon:yes gene_type:complete
MKRSGSERRLKKYLENKYEQNNIANLLNVMHSLMQENEELKERLSIVEQILTMHLPIIDETGG